jgi:Uma2 family endonuclease
MQTQTQKKLSTPEEYLQLEEASEFKNEYRDREIVPMAGGTNNHNTIADNCYAVFAQSKYTNF